MLIVLSPAKSLDYALPAATDKHTEPVFMQQSAKLIGILRKHSPAQIASLMKLSDKLAALNAGRYASWEPQNTSENAKQAVLAFSGDVYQGLDAPSLSGKELDWLQLHLRILSGLYGVLRPLDWMQPYRLEMGAKLANPQGKDLYDFWGESITDALNDDLKKQKALVNLASTEYFKSVHTDKLTAPIITPVFQDWSSGKYKIVPFHAKRARGLMARFAAQHAIKDVETLKDFDSEGYAFDKSASNDSNWVFRRKSK